MGMCTGFATDFIWVNTKVYSVTSEPTQNSGRHLSSFKDSSAPLIKWWLNFTWVKSFKSLAHCLWWKPKIYIGTQEICTYRWKQSPGFKWLLETQVKSCETRETYVKFTTQLFSSADESLKDETRLLLLWVGSLVTLYTAVFTYIFTYIYSLSIHI